MNELDRTGQRIVGVLIEKELTVPDTYPLTENALVAGCNQKSNRDPEMSLEVFQVQGAVRALMEAEWVTMASTVGGRAARYAHRIANHLAVDERETAILCELLVRGPQAPGALKPRVARLGFRGTPAEIEANLRAMAARPVPLVEQLPRRPRERDHRWRHLLGPAEDADASAVTPAPAVSFRADAPPAEDRAPDEDRAAEDFAALEERLDRIEAQLAKLADQMRRLTGG